MRAKALACYQNHVSVIESVSGDSAVVSEGGYKSKSVGASNGYCVIHSLSRATIESARGGGFLGYVYLTGAPVQPPAQGLSYSNVKATYVDTWNAELYGYINNPGRLTVSEVGVQIWDWHNNLVVNHREQCGLKTSYVEQRLNVVKEALPSGLKSGETYYFQMFAIANGTTYTSSKAKFIIVDNEKPIISNVKISNVTSEGYTVTCTVTDNYWVSKVQFPTWTGKNGQDDLAKDWGTNPAVSGIRDEKTYSTFTFHVNIADHNKEAGDYYTHIYAWDVAGNQSQCYDALPKIEVPDKNVETPTSNPTTEPMPTLEPVPTQLPVPDTTPSEQPSEGQDRPTDHPSPVITPAPSQKSFNDVSKQAWYYDAVQYVSENELMNGYVNGNFGPGDKLSRAQFAQILYNKAGRPAAGNVYFSDVVFGKWYVDAVAWAANNGIVSGYADGRFGPNDYITREQLAVILWRYAGRPTDDGTILLFDDAYKASDWSREALRWAVGKGIISGKNNGTLLDPKGRTTRAETAVILMRYFS